MSNDSNNQFAQFVPFETEGTSEKTVKYNLKAPALKRVVQEETETEKEVTESFNSVKVCLIGGLCSRTALKNKILTDGAFKAIDLEFIEVSALSLEEGVCLQSVQDFDSIAQPFIKAIHVAVKSKFSQVEQGKDNLIIIETIDNKGVKQNREVKGIYDNDKNVFVYPVNEKITFDKSVFYSLLSEISVDIEVVY